MTISRFRIAGMDCAAEEQLVRMALSDLDDIDRLDFDLEHRDVLIEHNADVEAINAALERLDLGAHHVDDTSEIRPETDSGSERNALILAFAINAGFFVGEFAVGLISRSMGLIADALDMGADASVYALSLAAVGTAATRKKQLARASGLRPGRPRDHRTRRSRSPLYNGERTSRSDMDDRDVTAGAGRQRRDLGRVAMRPVR